MVNHAVVDIVMQVFLPLIGILRTDSWNRGYWFKGFFPEVPEDIPTLLYRLQSDI